MTTSRRYLVTAFVRVPSEITATQADEPQPDQRVTWAFTDQGDAERFFDDMALKYDQIEWSVAEEWTEVREIDNRGPYTA